MINFCPALQKFYFDPGPGILGGTAGFRYPHVMYMSTHTPLMALTSASHIGSSDPQAQSQ